MRREVKVDYVRTDGDLTMDPQPNDFPRRRTTDGAERRLSDLPAEPSPNGKPRRRDVDGWLDRWVAATSDLTRLKRTHPMMDAVIDEQRGRKIRIGDRWLTDWASCNYLGFDVDEEIIASVPEYLARWGTHPSWSRLLGNPRLYPEIEEQLTELLGSEDTLVLPTITHIHMSVIPVLVGDGTIFLDGRAHKTIFDGAMVAAGHGATVVRFRHNDWEHLEELLSASDPGAPRIVAMDGVNSMTGNTPDMAQFARVAREHDTVLYVDDAHGFGVIGERTADELCDYGSKGNSVMRHLGVGYENVILVAGFSKSYSSLLAFLALPTRLKDALKVLAPPYLYSGPSPVASLATTLTGLAVNRSRGDEIRADLWREDPPPPRRAPLGRHQDPQHVRVAHHRGAPRRSRVDRRGRPLPLRPRPVRHDGGLPAGAEGRGRLPHPDHGGQHRRGGRGARGRAHRPPRALPTRTVGADDGLARRGRRSRRSEDPFPLLSESGASLQSVAPRADSPFVRKRAWFVYPLVAAVATAVYFLSGHHSWMFNLIGLSSPVLILVAVHIHQPEQRAPWYLFALGQFLFIMGDVVAYNYSAFHSLLPTFFPLDAGDTPYPAISDVLYLSVYPCLIAGLILLIRRRGAGRDRGSLIDAAMIAIGIGTLSWVFLISPYVTDTTLSGLVKFVSMGYPLMDMLMLTVAVRLAVGSGRRSPSLNLMVTAIVALFVTDSLYGWLQLHDGYIPGSGFLEIGLDRVLRRVRGRRPASEHEAAL